MVNEYWIYTFLFYTLNLLKCNICNVIIIGNKIMFEAINGWKK